jgi:hypothetical protein
MTPPFVLAFDTDFAACALSCPLGTPDEQRFQVALVLEAYLRQDEAHTYHRDRFTVQTWTCGAVTRGRN